MKLKQFITLGCLLFAKTTVLGADIDPQLTCTRYPYKENNGYVSLHLIKEANEYFIVGTNEFGLGSYFKPTKILTDSKTYILTANAAESGKCDEFAKCYDKISLYLSKGDDDGFIKNGVYKTTQAMMDSENKMESLHYICRHKNIENILKSNIIPLVQSCKVPPQSECSSGPKRVCCDCNSGQLACY